MAERAAPPDVTIRLLMADDAPAYRIARLVALRADPLAFLTTAKEFAARPVEDVASRLHPTAHA